MLSCSEEDYWSSLELISDDNDEGYVEISGVDLSQLTEGFTLEIWFRIDEVADGAPCVFQFPGANQSNELSAYVDPINSNEVIIFWKNEQFRMSFNGDMMDGEFHAIMVSWDGTEFNAYIDGVKRWHVTRSFVDELNLNLLHIGVDFDQGDTSPDNTWTGLVHELRIWSIALPDELIIFHANHVNKLLEDYNLSYLSRLDHVWRFNSTDKNKRIIPDETPNNNKVDAQIVGTVDWSVEAPK